MCYLQSTPLKTLKQDYLYNLLSHLPGGPTTGGGGLTAASRHGPGGGAPSRGADTGEGDSGLPAGSRHESGALSGGADTAREGGAPSGGADTVGGLPAGSRLRHRGGCSGQRGSRHGRGEGSQYGKTRMISHCCHLSSCKFKLSCQLTRHY